MMKKTPKKPIEVIGWREWVGLPDFGIKSIKVKVDTGARSSSLHVFDLHRFERAEKTWVSFKIHPAQRKSDRTVEAEAEVPKAMADAFRSSRLGIMDYYKLRNIQADTEMRKSIAGNGKGK